MNNRLFVLAAIINCGIAVPLNSLRGARNIPNVTRPPEISLQTYATPVSEPPAFARVDADKNLSISFEEFTKVMSAREPLMVKEMFQLFDSNIDQQLNEDEYSRFSNDINSYFSQTDDDVFKRFNIMDANKDNFVDLEEFNIWIEQNGGKTDQYDKLFKLSDSNNDQKISFDEFTSDL
uniref:EF-hand domain-containing protein n=1 Tax=Plectus sambesii TaxID=2011161 RepID=A0A914VX57_9BILA